MIRNKITNGETFRQIFPNIEVSEHLDSFGFQHGIHVFVKLGKYRGFSLWFPKSWWDAKYEGGEDDKADKIL